jgi:hypothetical protein
MEGMSKKFILPRQNIQSFHFEPYVRKSHIVLMNNFIIRIYRQILLTLVNQGR